MEEMALNKSKAPTDSSHVYLKYTIEDASRNKYYVSTHNATCVV